MLLICIAVQFAKLLANYAGIIHNYGEKVRQQCAVCKRYQSCGTIYHHY